MNIEAAKQTALNTPGASSFLGGVLNTMNALYENAGGDPFSPARLDPEIMDMVCTQTLTATTGHYEGPKQAATLTVSAPQQHGPN